jgi:hypothetical protein
MQDAVVDKAVCVVLTRVSASDSPGVLSGALRSMSDHVSVTSLSYELVGRCTFHRARWNDKRMVEAFGIIQGFAEVTDRPLNTSGHAKRVGQDFANGAYMALSDDHSSCTTNNLPM